MRIFSILVLFISLLSACSSPQYRAAKGNCERTWLTNIPPQMEQELYNKTESRQVPTGQTNCTTYYGQTTCQAVMRTEYYTVPAVRTVDKNKPQRDQEIIRCAQQFCINTMGNHLCE